MLHLCKEHVSEGWVIACFYFTFPFEREDCKTSIIFNSSNKCGSCGGDNLVPCCYIKTLLRSPFGGWPGKKKEDSRATMGIWPAMFSTVTLPWSQDSSPHIILSSLMPSWCLIRAEKAKLLLLDAFLSAMSPWCFQVHHQRRITAIKCASCFVLLALWIQPEEGKKKSPLWFAGLFLHRRLCDVICHFAVRSVVKRALETQYSNKCF